MIKRISQWLDEGDIPGIYKDILIEEIVTQGGILIDAPLSTLRAALSLAFNWNLSFMGYSFWYAVLCDCEYEQEENTYMYSDSCVLESSDRIEYGFYINGTHFSCN